MSNIFYKLGKMAGPTVRKAKWIWHTAASNRTQAIQTEKLVGRDMANEIRRKFNLDARPENTELLNKIGSSLTKCVADEQRSFQFESIDTNTPNAFCLPGGFIFVSSSLVDLCQKNKSEIAFVISHEMAHVIKGHAMERIMSNSAIAAASRTVSATNILAAYLREVGINFLTSAYSREQELQADELGLRLTIAAGNDPYAAIKFFHRIIKLEKNSEIGKYFSSHPPCKTRINHIKHLIDHN